MAIGPSQSFSHTVTIDAGSEAGIRPDMTVVNNDGLVGRVLRVTRSTATVLLVVDAESIVGGRVGSSMEVGFLHGRGTLADDGGLDLGLVDDAVVPGEHDTVVTWGSTGGARTQPASRSAGHRGLHQPARDSQRAVIEPFVDFSALDVVGVVVPTGTTSDRAVVEADGACDDGGAGMSRARVLVALAAVVVALVLQVSLFPHFAWHGDRAQPRACSWWSPPR